MYKDVMSGKGCVLTRRQASHCMCCAIIHPLIAAMQASCLARRRSNAET